MRSITKTTENDINEQPIWQYIQTKISAEPDYLKRIAVIDCTREYTYSQMFAEWKRYARVFSALGITGKNKARVALAGTISTEPLFAFYGLNMTGAEISMFSYPDFLPGGQWKTMAEKEHITDLLVSDIMLSKETWLQFKKEAEALGIRNVILLHSRLGGPCSGPAELVFNEFNYHALKQMDGTVFMDDLLKTYAEAEIDYGIYQTDKIGVITHTSGTTKGTRKPLPYLERSINIVASNYDNGGTNFHDLSNRKQLRLVPSFDFSSFLCMCGLINASFSCGDLIVLTFFGFMHPKFIRAAEYYQLDVMFTSGFMIDNWIKRTDIDDVDFSSIKVMSCGGSYLSPEKLRKYEKFFAKHGYHGWIYRGYGMSETGGTQLMAPIGTYDDVLGTPAVLEDFLIKDEKDGKYYRADEGERTGTMYITSESMCLNVLDGAELFPFTVINGRNYICTNDLVRVNKDRMISYAGRADKYFVNNDGVRFEAGLVETEMSKKSCINKCAVVPVLDKRIHDTVPVLYIVAESTENHPQEAVRKALEEIFIQDNHIRESCLPSQFVLVDEIPCNSNGKIDIFRITRERLKGDAFNINPVYEGKRVKALTIEKADQLNSITAGTLPQGMGTGSAMGIYDIFNTAPQGVASSGKPSRNKKFPFFKA